MYECTDGRKTGNTWWDETRPISSQLDASSPLQLLHSGHRLHTPRVRFRRKVNTQLVWAYDPVIVKCTGLRIESSGKRPKTVCSNLRSWESLPWMRSLSIGPDIFRNLWKVLSLCNFSGECRPVKLWGAGSALSVLSDFSWHSPQRSGRRMALTRISNDHIQQHLIEYSHVFYMQARNLLVQLLWYNNTSCWSRLGRTRPNGDPEFPVP